jgi:integrase
VRLTLASGGRKVKTITVPIGSHCPSCADLKKRGDEPVSGCVECCTCILPSPPPQENCKGCRRTAEATVNGALEVIAEKRLAPVGGVTVRGLGEAYLARMKASGSGSHQASKSRWDNWLSKAPFVDRLAERLDPKDVRPWIVELPGKRVKYKKSTRTVSKQYAHDILALLSAILTDAVDRGRLERNPILGMKVKALQRKGRPDFGHLDGAEVERLWLADELTDWERAKIVGGAGVGWRPGEQFTIRLEDVHALEQEPWVWIQYGSVPDGPTKTRVSRKVWLHGYGLKAIRLQLKLLEQHGMLSGDLNPHGLLYPGPLDSELFPGFVNVDGLSTWVKKRLARVGLTRRMTWYWASRHTYATCCLNGEWGEHWTLRFIGEQLGHTEREMTEIYAHVMPRAVAEMAKKADRALVESLAAKDQRRISVANPLESSGWASEKRGG